MPIQGVFPFVFPESFPVKALAVGAPARLPVRPDVPTFAELGIPQANIVSLFGVSSCDR